MRPVISVIRDIYGESLNQWLFLSSQVLNTIMSSDLSGTLGFLMTSAFPGTAVFRRDIELEKVSGKYLLFNWGSCSEKVTHLYQAFKVAF